MVKDDELEHKLQFARSLLVFSGYLVRLALLNVKHLLDDCLIVGNELWQVENNFTQKFLGHCEIAIA
jgi:hypothetical protein